MSRVCFALDLLPAILLFCPDIKKSQMALFQKQVGASLKYHQYPQFEKAFKNLVRLPCPCLTALFPQ